MSQDLALLMNENIRLTQRIREVEGQLNSMPRPKPYHHTLTISEIERLAKAGVKVDMDTVTIGRDGYSERLGRLSAAHLYESLLERIKRVEGSEMPYDANFNICPGLQLSVMQGPGKVWVSYSRWGAKPAIFEDELRMYPSDALMANIMLYDKNHPQPRDGALTVDAQPVQQAPANNGWLLPTGKALSLINAKGV